MDCVNNCFAVDCIGGYKGKAWELVRVIKTEIDKAILPILQAVELSEHQAGIIMGIKCGDSYTISKLAEHLNANQGNFSVTCKKMEQMGLVVRKRSREDERVVELELTPLGEGKFDKICKSLNQVYEKAQATPEQLEAIVTGCSEIVKLLKRINNKEKKC